MVFIPRNQENNNTKISCVKQLKENSIYMLCRNTQIYLDSANKQKNFPLKQPNSKLIIQFE